MTEQEWLQSEDPQAMLNHFRREWDKGGEYYEGISDRKLRLFACACCRANLHLSADPVSAPLVAAAEKVADGHALSAEERALPSRRTICGNGSIEEACNWAAMGSAQQAADFACSQARRRGSLYGDDARIFASLLRDIVGNPFCPVTLPYTCPHCRGGIMAATCVMCGNQPHLHPFRRVSAIVALAQATYDERLPDGALDPFRLALLADALEEAGCDGEKCKRCKGKGELSCPKCSGEGCSPYGIAANGPCTAGDPCPDCGGAGRIPHPALAHLRSPGPHARGCWTIDLILGKE